MSAQFQLIKGNYCYQKPRFRIMENPDSSNISEGISRQAFYVDKCLIMLLLLFTLQANVAHI